MKTLIIHPKDDSTTFLEGIYKNIADKTVVTGGVSRPDLFRLIEQHERVMMMGHGAPVGLFSVGQFKGGYGLVIDKTFVNILSKRDNNVFIWCNADMFVKEHKLKGFYSGMFISEVPEAQYCGLPFATQKMVDESNHRFCEILANHINLPQETTYEKVLNNYGVIAKKNPVAFYNHQRLYLNV